MLITFYAHASFRFEAEGVALITDPYTPAPGNSGFDRIDEAADLVIMSSATDRFHSDPSHIGGDPVIVNALELPPEGTEVRGVPIRSFPAYESKTFDYRGKLGRDPDANALYLFDIGGMSVLHMGDIGNPVDPAQLEALRGKVDILLALTGAHATIGLDDLDHAIEAIGPGANHPDALFQSEGRAEDRARRAVSRPVRGRAGHPGRRLALGADARHVAAGLARGVRVRAVTLTV